MKPFRRNVAISIDGGGIKGLIVTQALSVLEAHLGQSIHKIFKLAVGTSTGSIISAGLASGISARQMTRLYLEMGKVIFPRSLRSKVFPLTRYRYPEEPLRNALNLYFGHLKMGDFWKNENKMDLVITTYDLAENRTRFIKPWKEEYTDWPVSKAVQASCTVPTYFPVVDNRYIDGGVGSYGNPCYIAAYEARECLGWDPEETTLVSIGTGRSPHTFKPEVAGRMRAWDWLGPVLGVFSQSAFDQQVHLVNTYFQKLDFRRFQVNLREEIEMDDSSKSDQLLAYGARLGRMILNDQVDPIQGITIKHPGYF